MKNFKALLAGILIVALLASSFGTSLASSSSYRNQGSPIIMTTNKNTKILGYVTIAIGALLLASGTLSSNAAGDGVDNQLFDLWGAGLIVLGNKPVTPLPRNLRIGFMKRRPTALLTVARW